MEDLLKTTKHADPELWDLVNRERLRQERTLELVASESLQSLPLLELGGCVFNNKTAVGPLGAQELMGAELAEELMALCARRACDLFGADHANVQPYSGSTANFSVYAACLSPGDTVLSMRPDHGSHPTHGSPANLSGQLYHFVHYGIRPDTQLIDYLELEALAKTHKPRLIIAGGSAYSQPIDYRRIGEIAKSQGAYFMVDMAHQAGLVAAGVVPSPVPHADFVTSSTTKTICGPRSGFVLCKKEHATMLDRGVHPGFIASLHLQSIAAMAHTFLQASTPGFKEAMAQTVGNAQALCEALGGLGHSIVSGGTSCHLFVLDLRSASTDGEQLANALHQAGISVNAVAIPHHSSPKPNGVRLGCTLVTQRGLKEKEMGEVADIIHTVSTAPHDQKTLGACRERVGLLLDRFPLYSGGMSPELEGGVWA